MIVGSWKGDGEGELQGYGVITIIINGGLDCGHGGPDNRVEDGFGFYNYA